MKIEPAYVRNSSGEHFKIIDVVIVTNGKSMIPRAHYVVEVPTGGLAYFPADAEECQPFGLPSNCMN